MSFSNLSSPSSTGLSLTFTILFLNNSAYLPLWTVIYINIAHSYINDIVMEIPFSINTRHISTMAPSRMACLFLIYLYDPPQCTLCLYATSTWQQLQHQQPDTWYFSVEIPRLFLLPASLCAVSAAGLQNVSRYYETENKFWNVRLKEQKLSESGSFKLCVCFLLAAPQCVGFLHK